MLTNAWKTDNYKFVGKAFDFAFANRLSKLSPLYSEVVANSIDYELTGGASYGERSEARVNSRNGYRKRDLDTTVGTLPLMEPHIPWASSRFLPTRSIFSSTSLPRPMRLAPRTGWAILPSLTR